MSCAAISWLLNVVVPGQGAALTAEQILYEGREMTILENKSMEQNHSGDEGHASTGPGLEGNSNNIRPGDSVSKTNLSEGLLPASTVGSCDGRVGNNSSGGPARRGDGFQMHGRYFRASMAMSVTIAVAVSSSGVSTVGVISAAQVRKLQHLLCCQPTLPIHQH